MLPKTTSRHRKNSGLAQKRHIDIINHLEYIQSRGPVLHNSILQLFKNLLILRYATALLQMSPHPKQPFAYRTSSSAYWCKYACPSTTHQGVIIFILDIA